MIIARPEYTYCIDFVTNLNANETTGLTKEEKKIICDLLIENGLPLDHVQGKDDYSRIKDDLTSRLKPEEVQSKGSDIPQIPVEPDKQEKNLMPLI